MCESSTGPAWLFLCSSGFAFDSVMGPSSRLGNTIGSSLQGRKTRFAKYKLVDNLGHEQIEAAACALADVL